MPSTHRPPRSRAGRQRISALITGALLTAASCSTDDPSQALALAWPVVDAPSQPLLSAECSLADLAVRPAHQGSWAPAPTVVDGRSQIASVVGTDVLLHTEGGDAAFIAGVNVGPTIPGYQPGEVAIRREDFRRWFPMMADQGYRALRIYSIQPPSFYEELRSYNLEHPDSPLYLIHGAWIPEERFISERDLFAPGLQQEFFDEISNAVAVVFGDAVLPDRLGHAEGTYTADVSPWTYAWIIGVEWDPAATVDNNAANAGMQPFAGQYFDAALDASPTEIWIAGAVDHMAGQLAARDTSVPIAFANWPTTDPLRHPDEPLPEEDQVGVDANHVIPTNWPAGTFASYHAYPYYPDFQRYEAGIADCEFRGRPDNYAGYLSKLRQHHGDMPVMITEFGVPSAWAHAHFGPQGRDQGGHSEDQAMLINAEMMATIHDLGFSGGYVFQWTDEWFKFTWNTIDYELPPDRRQLWMNPWTNEAHFGVVAVEPGPAMTVTIDGSADEWQSNGSQVIQEGQDSIREVRALKDEGYLYLGITLADDDVFESSGLTIGFDTLPGQSGGIVGSPGVAPSTDYAATLATSDDGPEGQVWVAGHADVYRQTYGRLRGYFEVEPSDLEEGSSSWAHHQLITNRPLVIPTTGESFGVEVINAGLLRHGTSDPSEPTFDSRVAWHQEGSFLEIRIPFFAIGISDPSQRLAYQANEVGETRSVPFDRIGIDVVVGDEHATTTGYSWDLWQLPTWHERPKAGAIEILGETNRRLMGD